MHRRRFLELWSFFATSSSLGWTGGASGGQMDIPGRHAHKLCLVTKGASSLHFVRLFQIGFIINDINDCPSVLRERCLMSDSFGGASAEGAAPREKAAAAAAPPTTGRVIVGSWEPPRGRPTCLPDHPAVALRHHACLGSCVCACASWGRKRLLYAWNMGRLERWDDGFWKLPRLWGGS